MTYKTWYAIKPNQTFVGITPRKHLQKFWFPSPLPAPLH